MILYVILDGINIYHMKLPLCGYIKPFHNLSEKTRYITLFMPISRFLVSDVIQGIMT